MSEREKAKCEEFRLLCSNVVKFHRSEGQEERFYPPGVDKSNFRRMAARFHVQGECLFRDVYKRNGEGQ